MRSFCPFLVVIALAGLTAAAQVVEPDLILYFDYEEIQGDIVPNRAGQGNNGVINGDIQLVDNGKIGKAARFARGSFIDLDGPNWPAELIPREGMSVLAWVNVDNLNDHHAIFNARASDATWVVHPELRSEGNFRWLLRSNGGTTIFDIRAGVAKAQEWIHFAGTYDSNVGAVLYINGEKVGEAPGGGLIAEDWGMGARVGYNIDNARPFTGLMDELNIWKRGLTEEEVKRIMDLGPVPTAVNPQGKLAITWGELKSR
ncbi:MAG: hypothetical protein KatS3mg115_0964 [Candidatus Poribacteria bacterium]|nr:MAG: hypothetical protein KatS3mg115_0964 [Candidatus Poribacteria bacterium]